MPTRQYFKIYLMILSLVIFISNTFALPFSHCTDIGSKKTFQKKSELIVLIEVKNIQETTDAKYQEFIASQYVKGYIATCKILDTFKGKYNNKNINIFSFRDTAGVPLWTAFPIPFSLNKKIYYFLFLKKDKDGEYIPVTGHRAGEGSCIMVLKKINYISDYLKERLEKKKLRKEKNKLRKEKNKEK